ncbi:MAG: ABC transporter substrate-binding protein, partial [Rhodococcus sp. (in: high G+C Gram-positive bacteria)]
MPQYVPTRHRCREFRRAGNGFIHIYLRGDSMVQISRAVRRAAVFATAASLVTLT